MRFLHGFQRGFQHGFQLEPPHLGRKLIGREKPDGFNFGFNSRHRFRPHLHWCLFLSRLRRRRLGSQS